MPTTKPRISINLPKDIAEFVRRTSRAHDRSKSQTIIKLLEQAIEISEDLECCDIAEHRLRDMKGTISAKKFWSVARS